MDNDLLEPQPARVPFTTVLASIAGLWLCYFLLVTIRSELLDLGFEQEMLWRRAIASLAGVAITLGLWLVLRLFDARPLWAKITAALALSVPVAVMLAEANQLAFASIEERVQGRKAAQEALMRGDAPESNGGNGYGSNGHTNGGNGGGGATAEAPKPAAESLTDEPPVRPAKLVGLDLGPACEQCGGMMQRTGSCYTCTSCGNNTGCG